MGVTRSSRDNSPGGCGWAEHWCDARKWMQVSVGLPNTMDVSGASENSSTHAHTHRADSLELMQESCRLKQANLMQGGSSEARTCWHRVTAHRRRQHAHPLRPSHGLPAPQRVQHVVPALAGVELEPLQRLLQGCLAPGQGQVAGQGGVALNGVGKGDLHRGEQ